MAADLALLDKYKITRSPSGVGKWDVTYTWHKKATPDVVITTVNGPITTAGLSADMAAVQVANNVTFQ